MGSAAVAYGQGEWATQLDACESDDAASSGHEEAAGMEEAAEAAGMEEAAGGGCSDS